jgi:hypothetical protein
MTERYQRVRMDDLRHMKLFEKAKDQEMIYKVTAKIFFETNFEFSDSECGEDQSIVNRAQEHMLEYLQEIGFFGRQNIANILHITKIDKVEGDY